MGEWKNDKRCGFGISERSDGLKYEGEWFNNRKYGYGVTTFKDGSREEGKYKNNILITSNKKKHLFLIRSAKFRERIDSAVNAAQRASKIALQKADIAISRTATARGKAEQADYAAVCAREDSTEARTCAQTFDPNFHQPDGEEASKGLLVERQEIAADKLDLRVGGAGGGGGGGPGKLSLGAGHQVPGPGPPSPAAPVQTSVVKPPPPAPVTNHVGQSVIAPPKQPPAPVQRPAPPPRQDVVTPSQPDPTVLRQPASLQISEPARGRTPTRQERSRAAQPSEPLAPAPPAAGGGGQGGYNFQKIMDDRFEHYKRPPSRERSAGLGSRQGSRQQLQSRDASRDRLANVGRPSSRQITPAAMEQTFSENKNNGGLDSLNLDSATSKPTGNGSIAGTGFSSTDFKLPAEDQIRYRGVQQEIPHFGAPPKRTESLYMKASENNQQATFKVLGNSAMQRKKSLPDVATLPTVTVKQGSAAMTREEISVLSSARREEIRRQLEEADRYRANPILYILNPHIRDWFSRQQLMLVVLFVNVTLAIMFFKLLT